MIEKSEYIKIREKLEWVLSESKSLKATDAYQAIEVALDNIVSEIESIEDYELSEDRFYDLRDGALCDASEFRAGV